MRGVIGAAEAIILLGEGVVGEELRGLAVGVGAQRLRQGRRWAMVKVKMKDLGKIFPLSGAASASIRLRSASAARIPAARVSTLP